MRIFATPWELVRPPKRPTWTPASRTGAPVSPSKTITCTFERFGGGAGFGFGFGGGFSEAGGAEGVAGAACSFEEQPAAKRTRANRTRAERTRLRLDRQAGGMCSQRVPSAFSH